MTVLAIGTLTGKDGGPHVEAERRWIREVGRPTGLVRDVFLKSDGSGAILVLDGVDAAGAPRALAGLPFLVEGLIAFEYLEVDVVGADQ